MEKVNTVLVIDDDLDYGELLGKALARQKLIVEHFPRALIKGDTIYLMSANGKTQALDASRYLIALLDGRIKGGDIHGADLTPGMVAAGLKVVAISGHPGFNDEMVELGASHKITKWDLFKGVMDGKIDLRKLAA